MRCPECDYDIFNERLGEDYETIYECKHCGCEFTISEKILKHGEDHIQ